MILREQMKLGQKVEQLECQDHKLPITLVFLNSKNQWQSKAGCLECRANSNCSIFQIKRIEEYLYNWYQDEQQQKQIIDEILSNLIYLSKQFVKKFDSYMNIQIQNLEQDQIGFHNSIENTFIQKSVKYIANENRIEGSMFQTIVQFLSDQEINHNSIMLKSTDNISSLLIDSPIFETSQKLIKISQSNQYICERDKKWQQIFKETINQYQILQKSIATISPLKFADYGYLCDNMSEEIYALDISHDDKFIASGGSLGNIILWNLQNKQKLREYKCTSRILTLAFSKNSKMLAASLKFTKIEKIDILLYSIENLSLAQPIKNIQMPGSNVDSLLFTDDSKYLIAGGSLKIWHLESEKCIATEQIQLISSIAISSNQKYLLCGSFTNGQAYLLDCEQLTNLQRIIDWQTSENKIVIRAIVAFSPDDSKVVIASKSIKIWRLKMLIQKIIQPDITINPDYEDSIASMGVLQNGNIIMRQDRKGIQFYNSQNGIELGRIQEQEKQIIKARATANLEMIVACYSNFLVIYKKSLYR